MDSWRRRIRVPVRALRGTTGISTIIHLANLHLLSVFSGREFPQIFQYFLQKIHAALVVNCNNFRNALLCVHFKKGLNSLRLADSSDVVNSSMVHLCFWVEITLFLECSPSNDEANGGNNGIATSIRWSPRPSFLCYEVCILVWGSPCLLLSVSITHATSQQTLVLPALLQHLLPAKVAKARSLSDPFSSHL